MITLILRISCVFVTELKEKGEDSRVASENERLKAERDVLLKLNADLTTQHQLHDAIVNELKMEIGRLKAERTQFLETNAELLSSRLASYPRESECQ